MTVIFLVVYAAYFGHLKSLFKFLRRRYALFEWVGAALFGEDSQRSADVKRLQYQRRYKNAEVRDGWWWWWW
jgi:hypothetical protein